MFKEFQISHNVKHNDICHTVKCVSVYSIKIGKDSFQFTLLDQGLLLNFLLQEQSNKRNLKQQTKVWIIKSTHKLTTQR